MRPLTITGLFIALGCYAQQTKHTITVPAGTKVPLTLTGPLGTKSTRAGDPVHAETAFPVTVGTGVAIPTGTYLEGAIDKVIHAGRSQRAGLEMHFDRMIFASGYTVPLSGATAAPLARVIGTTPTATAAGFLQTTGPLPPPTLPQVSTPGRNIFIVGVVVAAAGTVVAAILLRRHNPHSNDDLFLDTGSKIGLVFQTPLTLDADIVAAAIATPGR